MILKDTEHSLQSGEITDAKAWEILDMLLDCFRKHKITEVTLIFGFDWQVGDECWADQTVKIDDIHEYIKAQEIKETGYLNYDDVYIKISDTVQVHFCHHSDMHLEYNEEDHPLIKDLRAIFVNKIGLKK